MRNELLSAIAVGGMLGVFTSLLFSLPVLPPHMHTPVEQNVRHDYGR